jgi:hypothetical protein
MSITFELSAPGPHSSINLANANACALLMLAGLPATPFGEVPQEEVGTVVARLLRAVNVQAVRASATSEGNTAGSGRWAQGARDDGYVRRCAHELLALCHSAQLRGCGVTWG